ncbi:phosphocholine cytidylyltransferase family protein [Natrarchaeobius oligotrophus]|uniref:Phosphocholine cytidylyltransferase family protein n=1 Tax=Natrarchaeobius chitinivorans TaxID=1679083 RepID=A0A3N6MG55_NATCH|nr:phosphocholine cytidylyltransferase family protein [Natrarchaeobius chitinivorans]RQH01958.1 phosphocholine cytidylyltransferase family protein [Natrarchaeobius chitinivorans]
MKAVHLAAGEGTRLRPITEDLPKPLVELGGRSLLERNVDTLEAAGVDEQVVVTGHCADEIRDRGYETVHNPVYDETDMIYSLFCAADAFPEDDDLVISYGDIVYEEAVVDALLECDAPLCVVVDREWRRLWELRFDDPLDDAETLSMDDDGRIHEIGGDTDDYDEIDAQYTGLLKVRADHVDELVEEYRSLEAGADGYVSIDTTAFLQRLIDGGWNVEGVPVDGKWLEVDSTQDLETYRELYRSGELSEILSL